MSLPLHLSIDRGNQCVYTRSGSDDTGERKGTDMVRTTREQRETLKRKWVEQNYRRKMNWQHALTYSQFRRTVEAGCGCIMVLWCGMWLGIEPDGYAHT